VAKLEAGNRKIPREILEQIADIFGQPIAAFETLATAAGSSPKLVLNRDQRELLLSVYREAHRHSRKSRSRTR